MLFVDWFLLLFVPAIVAALVLFAQSAFGTRLIVVDPSAVPESLCRKCRYTIRVEAGASSVCNCPECGADLRRPRALIGPRRERRTSEIVAALAILILLPICGACAGHLAFVRLARQWDTPAYFALEHPDYFVGLLAADLDRRPEIDPSSPEAREEFEWHIDGYSRPIALGHLADEVQWNGIDGIGGPWLRDQARHWIGGQGDAFRREPLSPVGTAPPPPLVETLRRNDNQRSSGVSPYTADKLAWSRMLAEHMDLEITVLDLGGGSEGEALHVFVTPADSTNGFVGLASCEIDRFRVRDAEGREVDADGLFRGWDRSSEWDPAHFDGPGKLFPIGFAAYVGTIERSRLAVDLAAIEPGPRVTVPNTPGISVGMLLEVGNTRLSAVRRTLAPAMLRVGRLPVITDAADLEALKSALRARLDGVAFDPLRKRLDWRATAIGIRGAARWTSGAGQDPSAWRPIGLEAAEVGFAHVGVRVVVGDGAERRFIDFRSEPTDRWPWFRLWEQKDLKGWTEWNAIDPARGLAIEYTLSPAGRWASVLALMQLLGPEIVFDEKIEGLEIEPGGGLAPGLVQARHPFIVPALLGEEVRFEIPVRVSGEASAR